jgi:hypothetical protein
MRDDNYSVRKPVIYAVPPNKFGVFACSAKLRDEDALALINGVLGSPGMQRMLEEDLLEDDSPQCRIIKKIKNSRKPLRLKT